jgi:hypothetical protein
MWSDEWSMTWVGNFCSYDWRCGIPGSIPGKMVSACAPRVRFPVRRVSVPGLGSIPRFELMVPLLELVSFDVYIGNEFEDIIRLSVLCMSCTDKH